MSRPLRIEYEDAVYHVMNRGRGRRRVFHGPEYYRAFLLGLDEAHRRFLMRTMAYCLMGNHYHLLVRTPQANLSRCMRHVNGLYTQRYNRLQSTDGPLFRGRYKAILVDANAYLLQASRYIHRNPIEARTPLVEDLADYPWSSYPFYLNQIRCVPWLDRDYVLDALNSKQRFVAYRRYVESGNDPMTERFYGSKKMSSIMGDGVFLAQAKERFVKQQTKEVSPKQALGFAEMNAVIDLVANSFGCERDAVLRTKRGAHGGNLPRWVAMYLCQERCGATLTEIAEAFHVGSYSTVSQTVRRLCAKMASNKQLSKRIEELIMRSQDLTP